MLQEAPCSGADRRELCCWHEACYKLLLQKFPQCVRDFVFFAGERVFLVASPDNRQNKVSGRLRELPKKKLSVFFGAGTARSAAVWPPLNCACVPQLFEQLINTMLCPAFLRKFICQPVCCVFVRIQTFYQNLAVVANTAVTSVVTNFRCHILIAKVNE